MSLNIFKTWISVCLWWMLMSWLTWLVMMTSCSNTRVWCNCEICLACQMSSLLGRFLWIEHANDLLICLANQLWASSLTKSNVSAWIELILSRLRDGVLTLSDGYLPEPHPKSDRAKVAWKPIGSNGSCCRFRPGRNEPSLHQSHWTDQLREPKGDLEP